MHGATGWALARGRLAMSLRICGGDGPALCRRQQTGRGGSANPAGSEKHRATACALANRFAAGAPSELHPRNRIETVRRADWRKARADQQHKQDYHHAGRAIAG